MENPFDKINEKLDEVLTEVAEIKETINNSNEGVTDSTLLSRAAAAEYLGVSFPTLHRYVNTGKLQKRTIAGKVYFTLGDIKKALK